MTTHYSDPSALRMHGTADHDSPTLIEPYSVVLEVQRRLEARQREHADWVAGNRAIRRRRKAWLVGEVLALAVLLNVIGGLL